VRPSPTRLLKDIFFNRAYPNFLLASLTTCHLLSLAKSIPNMRFRQDISRVGRIVFDLLA
jgi:hypothetical protein